MVDPTDEMAIKLAVNVVTEIFKESLKGVRGAGEWFRGVRKKYDPFGVAARRYVERVHDRYNTMRVV